MSVSREQRAEIRDQGSGIGRAFTLPELLVVIAISILLLAIAVPAFTSVLYNSRRSGAASAVETALAAARDVAVESGPGRDAAAVFFADAGGQIRIMVAVYAGEMVDTEERGSGNVRREIFVQSPRVESITLPGGWAVSGRARANTIGLDPQKGNVQAWYNNPAQPQTYPDEDEENWVYPETAFFDLADADDGEDRQTFMIRFAGGSGAMTYGADEPVLVLDPAPTRESRSAQHNPLEVTDQRRFVQRVLASRSGLGSAGGASSSIAPRILGDESRDTVLARPVGQVAVYNMKRLARAIGARRLNEVTGSLYAGEDDPGYDSAIFGSGASAARIAEDVNNWITGQPVSSGADSDAQIFTVQRYLGKPLEAVAIGEKETP